MLKSLLRSVVLCSLCCLSSACGLIDMVYLPPPEDTAQETFESANDYMRDKDYVHAVKLYNKLKDDFPFSPYTVDAELALGDAYFLDEEYDLASEAYKDFESLHPRHEAVPYVLYQIGMSSLKSFRSIDRATTRVEEGCQYFDRLLQMYPNSPYAEGAKEARMQCRRLIAEHELYIADVFWHMENYGPAWHRYDYVAKNFSDVKDVAEHARQKGIAAYSKYRAARSEETRQKQQGTWKDWLSWL